LLRRQKNKVPMTTNVKNAVMDAMAKFHRQTYAEFSAKPPAEQRQFIALLVRFAWPDFMFREEIQSGLSHKNSLYLRSDLGKDMSGITNAEFPTHSPNQRGFAEFAKEFATKCSTSPGRGVLIGLIGYFLDQYKALNIKRLEKLEQADAVNMKRIEKMDADAVVLSDGRHVFPDDNGVFWYFLGPHPKSQAVKLEDRYQGLAQRLLECKERLGIANGEQALGACRNEPGVLGGGSG
jgi:hypothetical protein